MAKNLINYAELTKCSNSIETSANNIISNLNKITNLVEMLPNSFVMNNSSKICEYINREKIVILKKYCQKCINISMVLKKINGAYVLVDNQFSSKQIIE